MSFSLANTLSCEFGGVRCGFRNFSQLQSAGSPKYGSVPFARVPPGFFGDFHRKPKKTTNFKRTDPLWLVFGSCLVSLSNIPIPGTSRPNANGCIGGLEAAPCEINANRLEYVFFWGQLLLN